MIHSITRKKQLVLLAFLFSFGWLMAANSPAGKLRTNALVNPLGIDTQQPRFSWQLHSDLRNQSQSAYQIIVASTLENINANVGDIWDSGKVVSSQSNNIVYAGQGLSSKTDYYWKTKTWNQSNEASEWSAFAQFGTAMGATDWSAKWLMGREQPIQYTSVELLLNDPVLARYIQLNVTEIGIPVNEGGKWRVQLAEMEVYGPSNLSKNLALSRPVTFSNEFVYGPWKASNLTDGVKTSTAASAGGCSSLYSSSTLASPITIQIDLGSEMMVDRLILYPRTDVSSKDNVGLVGSFPKNFTVQTKVTNGTTYTIRRQITNQPTPAMLTENEYNKRLPMFGTSIEITKPIQSAKVYASGLGLFEMSINGKLATNNVLEPGESTFASTILYATYDITDKLAMGKNAIIARLGNGMYNNSYVAGRYQKLNCSFGPLRFIAQIEITYTDGTKEVIATDERWKTSRSPITLSSWYGGEEYDARLEQAGINKPDFAFQGWDAPLLFAGESGKLKAQFYQPTTVVESWKALAVTEPELGVYVVDFGRNFAGQFEFSMKASAGVKLKMYPAEILYASGRINQSITPSVYDTYTFRGDESGETWGPQFVYHGFRYLEITGLPFKPTADQFTAKQIRAGVDKGGSFNTSNALLNGIETIITRAIESNLYNTLTDCPHREKLGWLEVPNLMFNSVAAVYDVSAWMPKISMDIKDNQLSTGMVPTTAPEFTVFGSPYRDDPTWSSAAITVPWQSYVTYGDRIQLASSYPVMVKLMNYFATRSSGYLLDYGLGDWGKYDASTTVGFTVSCTYYHLATVMSQVSKALNNSTDEAKYAALASNIQNALNTKYFKTATKTYDSGSQASNAMALYYGIVATENKEAVMQNLIKSVEKANFHLTTGEIALKPLFLSLAQNGHNDIVYQMATQTTQPSYGYFIEKGCTTLPEYWDMQGSLNHCMMGHIEGWFYEHLAGIRNNDIAFKRSIIQPYFAPDLNQVDVSTESVYGKIRSSWVRNVDKSISIAIEIPANSTATLYFPLTDLTNIHEGGAALAAGNGILSFVIENEQIKLEVGSGTYNFTLLEPPLVFSELKTAVAKAERNTQSNVTSGWEAMQTALTQAKSFVDNLGATQAQIEDATQALAQATKSLLFKNMALKKTPIYNSSFEEWGWTAVKLVDGQTTAGDGYSSAPQTTQHVEWVGVNFDYPYDLNKVIFYPRYLTNIAETFPLDFEIQVSTNGVNWESVVTKTDFPLPASTSNQAVAFTFATVKAQYVRIYANKLRPFAGDGGKYYLQLIEMEAVNE